MGRLRLRLHRMNSRLRWADALAGCLATQNPVERRPQWVSSGAECSALAPIDRVLLRFQHDAGEPASSFPGWDLVMAPGGVSEIWERA